MKYKVGISVLIPCYNMEKYIGQAIESLLKQTYQNWELIIIDDSSTDSSVEVINSFNDNRIKLHCLKNNSGNYFARNFGLGKVKGKYIAMMDADDISRNNRLEIQFNYLEKHKKVGAIGSNYSHINENGIECGMVRTACNYNKFKIELLMDNYMLQSSLFVRSHLLSKYKITYDERFTYASDYHFVFQCSKFFKIFNIDYNLVQYRINMNGISKTKFNEQKHFASKIRMEIFKHYYSEILSKKDMIVLDDLTNFYKIERRTDTYEVEATLNKILEYNYERRLLIQTKLYNFFYYLAMKFSNDTKTC